MSQIDTPGVLNPQTHPRIPGFEHLQGKIKRIECESVEMNYFPENY
jgi:hypothetical protein